MMSENVLPEEKYEKVSDCQQRAEKAYLTHDCHVDWHYKILCCKTESDLARMRSDLAAFAVAYLVA